MSAAVSNHLSLFKLDWLTDPDSAIAAGSAAGITDRHFIEMSAWCAELHAQLAELARDRDMPLLLMGGNASALRMEAASQRGSRDNGYLTSASEHDIRGLMDALVAQFATDFDEPLFRYRQLTGPPGGQPLPNFPAFAMTVPALLDQNAEEGRLSVKLEFHIEDDPDLFPEESSRPTGSPSPRSRVAHPRSLGSSHGFLTGNTSRSPTTPQRPSGTSPGRWTSTTCPERSDAGPAHRRPPDPARGVRVRRRAGCVVGR